MINAATSVASTVAAKGASTASPAEKPQSSATADYEAFLQLLMAEMKNQNPLQPTDSTQFVSQLASFSSVEQAIKTNTKLDTLISTLALNEGQGVIGRTLTSPDGSVRGVAIAVRATAEGTRALLEGGGDILLGHGVTISR